MKTTEAVSKFLDESVGRGLATSTIRKYSAFLYRFAAANPELPTDTKSIEAYLQTVKETPAHRGDHFKCLQALYRHRQGSEGIKSPVPSKGKVGRPAKPPAAPAPRTTPGGAHPGPSEEAGVVSGATTTPYQEIPTETAVNWFTTNRRNMGVQPRTFEVYAGVFKPFVAMFPVLPDKPEPIETFLGGLPWTPERKHIYYRTIKSMYRFLEERHGITNPMKTIRLPKPKDKVRDKLTIEQIQTLLSLDMSMQDRGLVMLLMDVGLRASAICELRIEDLKDGYALLHEKTGDYEVPISQETELILRALTPTGRIFNTPKGPMNRRYLYRRTKELLERIGADVGKKGPHTFRHTFATRYLTGGGDLMSLSQLLGHKKVSTTQIYASMAKEDLKIQHAKASPVQQILPQWGGWLCKCRQCEQRCLITPGTMPEAQCPTCNQVGAWYVIKYMNDAEVAEYKKTGEQVGAGGGHD